MSTKTNPDILRIDALTVRCGKTSGVYLECSIRGEKAYFPIASSDARRMGAELVHFATIVEARTAAPAKKR